MLQESFINRKSKVTVLMPVYNAEIFLDQSIQSILNQSYSDFIFLIINDGSTDNSVEVISKYLSDSRIKLLSLSENKGLIYCLNLGLDNINTEYVVRMDADDISHLDRLRILVQLMEQNPSLGICGTRVGKLIDQIPEKLSFTNDAEIRAIHLLNCSITHASAIYRMSVITSHSLRYRYDYVHSEDNDFITEILLKSRAKIVNLNLYYVNKHRDQVSSKYGEVQKINSSKRRAEFLAYQFGVVLDENEFLLYKALSYKQSNLNLYDFCFLKITLKKLNLIPNNQYFFDISVFRKELIYRVKVLFLLNYKLGYRLFWVYIPLLFIRVNPKIFFRLFLKILLK